MTCAVWSESERSKKWRSFISFLLTFGLITQTERLFTGFSVDGQRLLIPNEARSSPRNIVATKGSSVRLHWNYTYVGDGAYNGTSITFRRQSIMFQSSVTAMSQELALKFAQHGSLTLQSPVPVPFNGRVQVITSNSTLVIHRLQYNDSSYTFLSAVMLRTNISASPMQFILLRPNVSVTVNGLPNFMMQRQSALDVVENGTLRLTIHLDGNPRPSVDFRWPHLSGSSPTNVPSVQLYPFVYSSTYTLTNIPAHYCGRMVQVTLRNNLGTTRGSRSTNVTVLLRLNSTFGLRAKRITASKCIDVFWNQIQSGACYVKYNVTLKDASGAYLYSSGRYNQRQVRVCDAPTYNKAHYVQLKVSFRSRTRNVTIALPGLGNNVPSKSAPRMSAWMINAVSLVVLSKYMIMCLCWLFSDSSC